MKSTTYALIAVAAIAAFAPARTLVTCGRLLAISVTAALSAHASFHGHGGMEIINITEVKTIKN